MGVGTCPLSWFSATDLGTQNTVHGTHSYGRRGGEGEVGGEGRAGEFGEDERGKRKRREGDGKRGAPGRLPKP